MQTYNSKTLLSGLINDVNQLVKSTQSFSVYSSYELNATPGMDKWSVAQILEHLNSYNRYYLPAIKKTLNKKAPSVVNFKPGWIGNYFTELMRPATENKKLKKMKSPKDHSPSSDLNAEKVLQEFIEGQQQLLLLLEKAKEVNIGKLRTPISISPLIKLKLGDTFRFLIAHQQRHFVQINNTLTATNNIVAIL